MVWRRKRSVSAPPRGTQLPPPTQDHLHIRAILPPGLIVADDGTIAAVLEVSPVDTALLNEEEIQTYRIRFANMIAGLDHQTPLQITIATFPHRCEEYRDRIRGRIEHYRALAEEARKGGNEDEAGRYAHLAEVAEMHLSLMETLLEHLQPREERYLVTVAYNPFPLVRHRRVLSAEGLEKGKQEVELRVARVRAAFEHMGLKARRLDEEELLAVCHSFYHMSTSPLARATPPAVLASAVILGEEEEDGSAESSAAQGL